jgi:uncharacterized OsmC-like protein
VGDARTFAEKPHRVAEVRLSFSWPSLPAARLSVAQRAATLCPIHATLEQTTHVVIEGKAA